MFATVLFWCAGISAGVAGLIALAMLADEAFFDVFSWSVQDRAGPAIGFFVLLGLMLALLGTAIQ